MSNKIRESMAWFCHHIKILVLLPGRMFTKNIWKKGFTDHIQDSSQRCTEQSVSWASERVNGLVLLMVIFLLYMTGFGWTLSQTVLCIRSTLTMFTPIFSSQQLLLSRPFAKAGPWKHAHTAGPGFWSILLSTGWLEIGGCEMPWVDPVLLSLVTNDSQINKWSYNCFFSQTIILNPTLTKAMDQTSRW